MRPGCTPTSSWSKARRGSNGKATQFQTPIREFYFEDQRTGQSTDRGVRGTAASSPHLDLRGVLHDRLWRTHARREEAGDRCTAHEADMFLSADLLEAENEVNLRRARADDPATVRHALVSLAFNVGNSQNGFGGAPSTLLPAQRSRSTTSARPRRSACGARWARAIQTGSARGELESSGSS